MSDSLQHAKALVIDANANARMLIVSHLRDLGVGTVKAVSKTRDARLALETSSYDIVVSDNDFGEEADSGQQLLDELRREQILPQSTVFIMVTADATYASVAGAAEAALDAYLLKPYNLAGFAERLHAARHRKLALKPIFDAMDAEAFDAAAQLCLERFAQRAEYWLYAARLGAELLLRLKRNAEARALYEAIVEAKTVPWAKLGVARAEYAAGQLQQAKQTLELLVGEMPDYADGWDVLGRVQMDEGNLELALKTYQQAMALTPGCLLRAQRTGTLAFYAGRREEALRLLESATVNGLRSRLFDYFSLVLVALIQFDAGERQATRRQLEHFEQLLLKHPGSLRLQRQQLAVQALVALHDSRAADAVQAAERLAQALETPAADLEAACLVLAVWRRANAAGSPAPTTETVFQRLALRYCVNKASTEVMVAMCERDEAAAGVVRQAHDRVFEIAEQAMTLSLKGKPELAVRLLAEQGEATRNAKLIDMAMSVLRRHAARIEPTETRDALEARVRALQEAWVLPITGSLARAKAGQPLPVPLNTRGPAIEGPAPPVD